MRSLLKLSSRTNIAKLAPTESNLNLGKLKIRQRINSINKILKSQANYTKLNNSVGSQDITSVNTLSNAPLGKLKHLKRQRDFVWLTTHVWHAKRSHMIKRWGFQIPYKPTQKCFRLAHRNFNLSGGICWDKSYVNTLVLETPASGGLDNLKQLFKLVTKREKLGQKFFGNGAVNDTLVYKGQEVLGDATVLSFINEEVIRVVIRVHPSIYETFFNYLVEIKHDDISVIDNRYSIGSIDITGPIALESLATVLKPINFKAEESQVFGKLACEASLPDKVVFTLHVKDPRLSNRSKPRPMKGVNINDTLIDMKVNKTNLNDSIIDQLLSSEGRTKAYENQLSLKDIEKLKKSKEKSSGNGFPVTIYKHNGIFTVLLPWYWTLPVWYQLNRIAHLNHGGTFQSHQFKFEKSELFFPLDFPFTKQGLLENLMASNVKREKWEIKPNSKKLQYHKLKIHKSNNNELPEFQKGEIGDPFGCDWRYLQILKYGLNQLEKSEAPAQQLRTSSWDPDTQQRKIEQLHDVYDFIKDTLNNDQELKLLELQDTQPLPVALHPNASTTAPAVPTSIREPLPVVPISVRMPSRGSPSANARVYSIPPQDLSEWLKTLNTVKITGKKDNDIQPPVPHSSRLIGYITSGSFNLGKGFGTGVGAIDARFARESEGEKYVVVRNVGEDFARLSIWKEIELV